jgi:pyruvate dehydrogenase E2 component (dihydrolipoamide acetyltransferase)
MPRGPDESLRSSPPVHQPAGPAAAHRVPHASPLVRRKARELGIDLAHASASGPHGRVLEEDLKSHVRSVMSGEAGPAALPRVPEIDHERFGPTELLPLTRTRRSSGANLMRSWLNVPHVTQHDEADVSELEAFRLSRLERARERGLRLSPLHFVMKACVLALRRHPRFRSSLHPSGDSLIVKNYYHLGVAADTEAGLVVPVVRDVDRKGLYELAAETAELAERARAHKLSPLEIQGACFTISSLGGIGGTAFTPIVNAPEVAVLGVSRMQIKPLWREAESGEGSFEPRKVLPLSLSYDHRAIDGADAARFTSELKRILEDPASLLL